MGDNYNPNNIENKEEDNHSVDLNNSEQSSDNYDSDPENPNCESEDREDITNNYAIIKYLNDNGFSSRNLLPSAYYNSAFNINFNCPTETNKEIKNKKDKFEKPLYHLIDTNIQFHVAIKAFAVITEIAHNTVDNVLMGNPNIPPNLPLNQPAPNLQLAEEIVDVAIAEEEHSEEEEREEGEEE